MPKASATSVNFADRRKQAEQAGLIGSGDYLKLKEGGNKMRLLTECLPHSSSYQGKPTFKWLCYVIDRQDGKVKPFFMPHTIYKHIEALQLDADYTFDGVPMPYDITVNAKGAGTKDVEYSVLPAKKETPVTAIEHQELAKQKPLPDLQKALLEKKGAEPARARTPADEPADDDYPYDTEMQG